jgi:glycosyltransferase involved in cell wall biosynthesis
MKLSLPVVSVIIPARNEEDYIEQCLDSVLDNDYPREKLDIAVVDGMSEDKTREIVAEYSAKHKFIKCMENPERIAPTALNIGIKNAVGDVIIRMDAHNLYESDYISKCVKYLGETDADNVGGIWITIPGKNTAMARAIAFVLSSPFGVGNAYFRIGSTRPRYVDTVPFGCYKREVFENVGFFNEELVRNQDIEFNARLRKHGGKILLVPEIKSYYHARPTLWKLCSQNWRNGVWNIYLTRIVPRALSTRHLIPLLFVLGLLGCLAISLFFRLGVIPLMLICGSYLLTSLVFSVRIGLRQGVRYIPILPVVFFSLHFSYGSGMLWGIFTVRRFMRKRQNK